MLKIYQGFKFEEMAEILSCPVSTVKSRLYTALDLLKANAGSNQHAGCRMSCSSIDMKAYALGEAGSPGKGDLRRDTSDRVRRAAARSWSG